MRRSNIAVGLIVILVLMLVSSAGAATAASTSTQASGTKPVFSWQSACTKNPALSWLPICDLLNLINTEITNRQAADTSLQTAINNIPAGQACWDLNNNHACDKAAEDTNGDGACDVKDCKGAKGDTGATGTTGATGATGPAGTCDPSACTGTGGTKFGSWNPPRNAIDPSYNANTIYAASTDGFVLATLYCDDTNTIPCQYSCDVVINPPAEIEPIGGLVYVQPGQQNIVTLPVRNGDSWTIFKESGAGYVWIEWLPIVPA